MKTFKIIVLTVVVVVILVGAGYMYFRFLAGEKADVEGDLQYLSGRLPKNEEVYHIQIEVTGSPNGVVRQTEGLDASFAGMGGVQYGYISGSQQAGKVLIRGTVMSWSMAKGKADPIAEKLLDEDTGYATPELIFKVTDLKANALEPDDTVMLSCRLEIEAIGAASKTESLSREHYTYEFDLCKLLTPITNGKFASDTY